MDGYRDIGTEDRSVLIVAFRGRVFGLNPEQGDVMWERVVMSSSMLSTIEVLIHDQRVYATNGKQLCCFEYRTGREIARVTVPHRYPRRPTMVVERERLFLGGGGEIACFTLDCETLWNHGFKGKGIGPVGIGFPGNFRQADERGQ